MKLKNNILMICSWVSHDSNLGVFFREQAQQLSTSFNVYLTNFSPLHLGFRTILKTKSFFEIKEVLTVEGLILYYVTYPQIWFIPKRFDEIIKGIAVKKFIIFLTTKKIYPNLIHAQSIFDAGFWAHRFYEKNRTPYIITEHNQLSFANKSIVEFKKTQEILRFSKTNCVVSNDKIRQFAANGLFYDFTNVGNSVDSSNFNIIGRHNNDSFNILTVGAYAPIKDQKTILIALKKLDDRQVSINRKIIFTWIGYEGWGEQNEVEVQNLLKSFDFKNVQIKLIKIADRKMISNEMKSSNIFVLSSLSEGMPVSVLESLACGTPVITTNCGGVDELINDLNGKIVPVQDFNSIFHFLEKLINNEIHFDSKFISMGLIEKFGSKVFEEKMRNIYNNSIQ